MQLTANFVVLATALVYSSRVFALPVDSTYTTRDVEYDLEAREVGPSDMLKYSTRELYDMYLEARSYYNEGLDARDYQDTEMEAREYVQVEDLEARAVDVSFHSFDTCSDAYLVFFYSTTKSAKPPKTQTRPMELPSICLTSNTRQTLAITRM